MTPTLSLLSLVLLAGFALGLFFYGGLWYTVRALSTNRHPALLMVGSFWIRTAAVVTGFYYLMDAEWQRAAICLAGFVAARLVCTRFTPSGPHGKGVH